MNLSTKNFARLVQDWAAIVQSSVAQVKPNLILSFEDGSILLALAEAQASVSLWLQGLILKLLTATRLATSQGQDVDTWCADFMPGAVGGAVLPDGTISPRLPANAATGLVTFSRSNPTNPAIIPVGAQMQSADGTQTYLVTADPSNPAYSAAYGGYVLPAQVNSLAVPVQFQFPAGYVAATYTGPVGNVQAGAITILQTGISGVDTITNETRFANGFNSEPDPALKARFPLFISSLAKGTEGAIGYAIMSVQQGMQYQIWEPGVGGFTQLTVYVDDGSGAIPSVTLEAARANVYATKAAGVPIAVLASSVLYAGVSMTLVTKDGYYHPDIIAKVAAALDSYIDGIGLGATPALSSLSYLRLAQVAFDASPAVIDVTSYTLNGGTSDLVPAAGQTIKSGSILIV